MSLPEILKDGAPFRASDSRGDFSEEFIADVLEAKREAQLGLGKRFASVDDLVRRSPRRLRRFPRTLSLMQVGGGQKLQAANSRRRR